jgi:hypothetical protein
VSRVDTVPRVPLVDLRHEQQPAHPKTRIRNGRTVQRDPAAVTSIVVHQTAVRYGLTEAQLRASKGNRQLALARRGLNVACHAIAFRDGFFAATHPLCHYVNHGNGFNAYSLGLEIDGLYPGLSDDPTTVPIREDLETTAGDREPDEVTQTIVDTARAALRWLVEEGRRLGMPVTSVYAHRQSSGTRRADPGEPIWRPVVLDYAVPVLGLRVHPDVALAGTRYDARKGRRVPNNGRPLPRQWGGAGAY